MTVYNNEKRRSTGVASGRSGRGFRSFKRASDETPLSRLGRLRVTVRVPYVVAGKNEIYTYSFIKVSAWWPDLDFGCYDQKLVDA